MAAAVPHRKYDGERVSSYRLVTGGDSCGDAVLYSGDPPINRGPAGRLGTVTAESGLGAVTAGYGSVGERR